MRILLFGGSFDPVTNAHIGILKEASNFLNCEKVILIPNKSPRWKTPNASIEDRLNMLKIALNDENLNYDVSDFEINSENDVNYSIDTIKHYKSIYPNDEIYFLIGSDQVNQFDKWKDCDEISKLVSLACAYRTGIELNHENILRFNIQLLSLKYTSKTSSSDVRSLKSLDINPNVLKYIETNHLYFVKKASEYVSAHRIAHMISVANLCKKVSESNKLGLDYECYVAGLLHDVGKKFDNEDSLALIKEKFPNYSSLEPFAYHQFVSSVLVKTDFAIENELIIDAIAFHTTGKANMNPIGMIVYACDKIDPLRGFDSSEMINECLKNYEDGFKFVLAEDKKYLSQKGKDISNILTDECLKHYLGK